MGEVNIRRMQAADLPAVVEVMEAVLKEGAQERWHKALEHYIQNHPAGCLIALAGRRTVGFIVGEIKIWGFGLQRSGWVETVGVDPRYMGRGVGQALGKALLDYFRSERVDGIYTAVSWDSGDLQSFFKSLGFAPSGMWSLSYQGTN